MGRRKRSELRPRNGRTLMVGIVARISGGPNQKELSLDDQVDHAKQAVADLYGGPVEYVVIATTGKGERLDRPELARVEELLRSRRLDLLVVEDLGRLVRAAPNSATTARQGRVVHAPRPGGQFPAVRPPPLLLQEGVRHVGDRRDAGVPPGLPAGLEVRPLGHVPPQGVVPVRSELAVPALDLLAPEAARVQEQRELVFPGDFRHNRCVWVSGCAGAGRVCFRVCLS